MALSYSTTIRTNRLTQVSNATSGGSTAAKLRIYSGTRPATGGTVTTLLAELTFSTTPFSNASQTLTANTITGTTSAPATGTATWGRVVDSSTTFVMDFDVSSTGGSGDLKLSSVAISSGQSVDCSSFVITAGNA